MYNNNWRMSDLRQRRLFGALRQSSKLRARRRFVALVCGAMLMALVLLLSACTTQPQQPCETPQFPMPPALSEPTPLESYSEAWRKLAEAWRKKLTGTH